MHAIHRSLNTAIILPYLLVAMTGCALFQSEEAPEPEDSSTPRSSTRLLMDEGPFDPAAALTPPGGEEKKQDAEEKSASESAAASEEAEVAAKDSADQRAVETANQTQEDEDVKEAVAHSPPPPDPGRGKGLLASTLDIALDIVLLALIAFVIAASTTLVRWRPVPAAVVLSFTSLLLASIAFLRAAAG